MTDQILIEVLRQPVKNRKPHELSKLVPFLKNVPFFRDRELQDTAITETLSLMTFKEMEADDFVIEYGTFGDEFYVILDGECEVLVPNQQTDLFKHLTQEIKAF